jgi:hypothetical protein
MADQSELILDVITTLDGKGLVSCGFEDDFFWGMQDALTARRDQLCVYMPRDLAILPKELRMAGIVAEEFGAVRLIVTPEEAHKKWHDYQSELKRQREQEKAERERKASSASASPRPWKWAKGEDHEGHECVRLTDDNNDLIAHLYGIEAQANAQYITETVNQRDRDDRFVW